MDARSPEELDSLLEDAFVMRDARALASLFEADAVACTRDQAQESRGRVRISDLATSLWALGQTHVSQLERVLQTRDSALALTRGSTSLMQRRPDGRWRYAIVLFHNEGGYP